MIEDHIDENGLIYWDYEAQTKKKHEILKDYLEKWIWIVGSSNPLNYFDCFGGCGKYKEKDGKEFFGSPIFAAQLISKNKAEKSRTIGFIVIEKKEKYIENLKKILVLLKLNPDSCAEFECGDFDTIINKILDEHPKLAPSLFFIDPFGFAGLKLSTLKRIMEREKFEIVLNFMFNSVNRFLEIEQNEKNMTELFGDEEWKSLCDKSNLYREKEIIELLDKRLKGIAKYVTHFRFSFEDINRTYYYIFHLTNHEKGCNIFKSCVGKYCGKDFEYKGKNNKQKSIFDYTDERENKIKTLLIGHYSKKVINFGEIFKEQIDKIKGTEGDLQKALASLEKEGKVKIERIPSLTKTGKVRESIKYQDCITFI
jgi:three-Cys-motif partner protein